MKKPEYDSHCVECQRPCFAPRGNFNANRVSLCKSPKCRRARKTALQRERRKQLDMALFNTRQTRSEKRKAKKLAARVAKSKHALQQAAAG